MTKITFPGDLEVGKKDGFEKRERKSVIIMASKDLKILVSSHIKIKNSKKDD